MRLSPLAYACFVIPCAVIALCFTVTTRVHPDFPVCFPFVSGCASISAMARQEPSIHLFRLFMLPVSLLMAIYWWIASNWVRERDGKSARGLLILGAVSAAFLALYATFLGTDGEIYALLRRFGTTLYFGGTGLAALILTARIWPLQYSDAARFPRAVMIALLADCILMLGIGIAYIPVAELLDASWLENVFEWNYAFLLHIHFGLISILWRRQALRVQILV
jgi:hypothetical protein